MDKGESEKGDRDTHEAAELGAVAGIAVNSQRLLGRAANAKLADQAIAASHARKVAEAASRNDFVRDRAAEIVVATRSAAETGTRSGAREEVKGHFIEAMTTRDYNAAGKLVRKRMVGMTSPTHPTYDARHFVKKGGKWVFAGADQMKSSRAGTEKAISQMEKLKPGSARRAILRVPQDEVAATTRRAAGRIRVKGNGVTKAQSAKRLDGGLKDLAKKGPAAGSKLRAAGKSGVIGAATTTAIGTAKDVGALRSGDLSRRHFLENRGLDVVEGGGGALIGSAAASGGGMVAAAGLGTAAGGTFAASAGAAGTAALTSVGAMGVPGAAIAGALGGLTAPVVIPAVAGAGASLAVGFAVTRGFKKVRGKIEEGREALESATLQPTDRSADSESQGQEARLARRGRSRGDHGPGTGVTRIGPERRIS